MPSLTQRLNSLRRRVRWMVLAHGMCLLAAGALGTLLVLGGLDYLARFQDRGLRMIASLVFFAALAWFGYRYLYLPGRVRLSDRDLAFLLQRRFPVLDDRLQSAVEFMRQSEDDPTAGSAALRRTVIAAAAAQAETLDFRAVLDGRPPRRAAVLAGTVAALAAALFAVNPPAGKTAAARLLNPLSNAVYPQRHRLTVRNPVERIARGGKFEIEIVEEGGGTLPREIRVFYRIAAADGGEEEESATLRPAGQSVVVRRENIVQPFAYRLEGGDDRSMPWREVAVVDPPAVKSLVVRMIPPAYTGWPAARSPGDVRALEGTRLEISGRANKPLRSAELLLGDGRRFSARLSADGRGFTVDAPGMVVKESGEYGFALEDDEGIAGGENDRWLIRAVPDAPPSVTIEQPAGNVYVTPRAVVPLRVQAKDDLALREVKVIFPGSKILPLSLWERAGVRGTGKGATGKESIAEQIAPHPNPLPKGEGTLFGGGESQTIAYRWELEPLGLKPGTELEFAAVAADYRPQSRRSDPRKLIVVAPRELQERLVAKQNLLLGELERVLKMQQAVRNQADAVRIRWEKGSPLEQADLQQLRTAEFSQRQATALLSRGEEGIPRQLGGLLADVEANRLEMPAFRQRLEELSADLLRLEQGPLPAITRELTAALKTGESASAGDVSAALRPLQAAEKEQDRVIAALEAWIARFSQWESAQHFQRGALQLQRDQEETARRTAAVAPRTLGRSPRDLPPAEAAELQALAARQAEHARTLERLLQEMERSLPDLRRKDPAAARSVEEALAEIRRGGAGGRMRSCGEFLEKNQIGQAAEAQKDIAEQLQKMLDRLNRRPARELAAEQLARLTEAVAQLQGREKKILDETRRYERLRQAQGEFSRSQTAGLHDLGREQEMLEGEARRWAKDLRRAEVLAYALTQSAASMAEAAAGLDDRQTGPDTQRAEQAALDRLAMLAEAVKSESAGEPASSTAGPGGQKPPGHAPGEAIAALAELKLLRQLQEDLNRRTADLPSPDPKAPVNDQQRRALTGLAEEQGRLAEMVFQLLPPAGEAPEENDPLEVQLRRELGEAAEQEDDAPLLGVARRMVRVERRLKEGDAGPAVRNEQAEIVEELDRLIDEAKKSGAAESASTSQSPERVPPSAPSAQPGPRQAGPPGKQPAVQSGPASADEKRPGKPDAGDIRAALEEHWGELPPHVAGQMLQTATEEFMPKYQEMLEAYYRRLAEEKKQ